MLDKRPAEVSQNMHNCFVCKHFENIIKDQITFNTCSINVTRRTFVHNFERTLPVLRAFHAPGSFLQPHY